MTSGTGRTFSECPYVHQLLSEMLSRTRGRYAQALSLTRMRPVSRPFGSTPLPLDLPSTAEEAEAFSTRTAQLENYFSSARFGNIKRPYSAHSVATKQGSLPPLPLPSSLLADKLYALLERAANEGRPIHTLGAIDPVQVTQMARYLEVVYVSGWAVSSVLTTANNEVGPDLA